MLTTIAYLALLMTLITTIMAIKGYYYLYWIAAISIYIFSAIAGFTIGQWTVGLTFVFVILAIGYSFGWIRSKLSCAIFVVIGILMGLFMVVFVDDYWLFYPLTFFN